MRNVIKIYNFQGIEDAPGGYVMELEDAKYANADEDSRINFISATASVSRGKESFNFPEARYKHLFQEAAFGRGSRPLEFCPVYFNFEMHTTTDGSGDRVKLYLKDDTVYDMELDKFLNTIAKFGIVEKMDRGLYLCKTNLRAMINTKIPYEYIPYNKICTGFRVFKLKIPMFVFNHLVTHTQLSKETRSDRVTLQNEYDYWLPEDFIERILSFDVEKYLVGDETDYNVGELMERIQGGIASMRSGELSKRGLTSRQHYEMLVGTLLDDKITTVRSMFKILGYPKEIWQRAMLEFRYKDCVFGGYTDQHGWYNLLAERGGLPSSNTTKNWTQKETAMVAKQLNELMRLDLPSSMES